MNLQAIQIVDGVDLLCINDDRFTTNRIAVNLAVPLNRDSVSANAILPFLLRRASKAYPNMLVLNRRLDELYGARIYADVSRVGEAQMLTLSIAAINDKFSLSDESIAKGCISLLCQLLFEPDLQGGLFRQSDIEQERRQLIERIDGELNDKRTYAKKRCRELMCSNERYGASPLGTRQNALNLKNEDIVRAWKNALKHARIRFNLFGQADSEFVRAALCNAFSKIERGQLYDCAPEIIRKADTVKEYEETLPVNQGKLVMGFRTSVAEPDRDVFAMVLTNALFGGTPHSRLFLNVREKLSLCYYCAASYDRRKGVIFVDSGIEFQNKQSVVDEVQKQLECIKNNEFEDSELSAAIKSTANNLRSIADLQGGLESWYTEQIFDGKTLSPVKAAEMIEKVKREDVVNCASRITLDTIYMLKGEEKQHEN